MKMIRFRQAAVSLLLVLFTASAGYAWQSGFNANNTQFNQGVAKSLLNIGEMLPGANQDTYFKVIRPDLEHGNGIKGPELHCNERTDLTVIELTTNLPYHEYPQYDPVLSATAMCRTINNPSLRPVVEFTSWQGDPGFLVNSDGTPLQRWGIRAYCQAGNWEPDQWTDYFVSPAEVILLCIDGKKLKVQ